MLANTLLSLPGLTGLEDEDGDPKTITLLPPASEDELRSLSANLPAPLPPELLAALRITKGLHEGPLDSFSLVDLGGLGMDDAFPYAYCIGADGFGNFWILDAPNDRPDWGPVWYVCHDPAVIAFQSPTIEHFLLETVKLWQPGPRSEVDLLHDDIARRAWGERGTGLSQPQAIKSEDPVVREFAQTLGPDAVVVDLRQATVGGAFAWGCFGPETCISHWQREHLWALTPPRKQAGLPERLFNWR